VPFFQIAESVVSFAAGVIKAGQVIQGQWPLQQPSFVSPNLLERWDLYSIYLPLSVQAQQTGPTPPSVCRLTPRVYLSGELIFQEEADLSFSNISGATNWVGAVGTANAQLPNAIAYRSGQTLELTFQALFDQDVLGANIILAGLLNNPVTGPILPSPGSVGYAITLEPFSARITSPLPGSAEWAQLQRMAAGR
jgi:FtsP/CotA-like multicopper oxidase with cupredoxin domain